MKLSTHEYISRALSTAALHVRAQATRALSSCVNTLNKRCRHPVQRDNSVTGARALLELTQTNVARLHGKERVPLQRDTCDWGIFLKRHEVCLIRTKPKQRCTIIWQRVGAACPRQKILATGVYF
jgi:hypothetical protein